MTALRSALYNVFFFIWTTLIMGLCLPLTLAPPIMSFRIGRIWARVAIWGLKVICGLRYELRGLENMPPAPYLMACKHQSAWDTLLIAVLTYNPSLILKAELMAIPIFGRYLRRSGMIPIDRARGAKSIRDMIARAGPIRDEGRPIVIFPEGTRTLPGSRQPYHPGVAALYRELGLPVVPLVLNSGLFWGRNSFLKKPGCILVEILPPIEPGLHRKVFLPRLETAMEDACARLVQESLDKGATLPDGTK